MRRLRGSGWEWLVADPSQGGVLRPEARQMARLGQLLIPGVLPVLLWES